MRKHGVKFLGVALLAAASMMAVGVAAAQAGSEIEVEGAPLAAAKTIKGTVGSGDLLTAGGIEIGCAGGTISGSIENVANMGSGSAQVEFTECEVLGADSVCKVYDKLNMVNPGVILASGSALLIEHEGEHYLLLKGLGANELFAQFAIEDPLLLERCPLPEEEDYEITGRTVIKVDSSILTPEVSHTGSTLDPATLAKLFPEDQLFLGKEKAHLSGGIPALIALVSLEEWNVK